MTTLSSHAKNDVQDVSPSYGSLSKACMICDVCLVLAGAMAIPSLMWLGSAAGF